jgi:hypothetical protein
MQQPHQTSKTMSRTPAVPHRFLGTARTHLSARCTRLPYSRAEKAHQRPFLTPSLRTFLQRNNHHIRHAATEVRRNGRRDLTLRRCHRRTLQAKLLLRKNYAKRRDSPFVGVTNHWIQEPCPPKLAVIID